MTASDISPDIPFWREAMKVRRKGTRESSSVVDFDVDMRLSTGDSDIGG